MTSIIFFIFLGLAVLNSLINWRLGVSLLILVGVLQDPVRKLMPDAPFLMVLAFFPVWLAILASSLPSVMYSWRSFSHNFPDLRRSILLFFPVFILATIVLLFNYGIQAWKVALVGNFTYILPLITLVVGYTYARSELDVYRLIRFYCVVTAIALSGGVFEVMNIFPGWNALGTSVLGTHWIRYVSWGHTIDLIAGFYRSPDIMGWHAATLTILSLSMALYGKAGGIRWFWLLLASWGVLLVLISGRNKMLGMTFIWGGVVALIYLYYGKLGKMVALTGAGGLLAIVVFLMFREINLNQDYILYASNFAGGDVIGETPLERLNKEVLSTTMNTYRQAGFFGNGIGLSAQGIQHLGVHIKRSWQESGLSRILVELGIPGLVAVFFFLWQMLRIIYRMVSNSRQLPHASILQTSLIAFAIANMSNFTVSHQVFSDGFVLVILTFMVGFLLASSKWKIN